jgi:hypothetical protein
MSHFGRYFFAPPFNHPILSHNSQCVLLTHRSVAAVNADFELSPTYPMQFIMPTSFLQQGEGGCLPSRGHASKPSRHTETQHGRPISGSPTPTQTYRPSACIKQLASFRSNRRFPIVCWKSPANGLTLMRSSQPMVGFLGARCSFMNDFRKVRYRLCFFTN